MERSNVRKPVTLRKCTPHAPCVLPDITGEPEVERVNSVINGTDNAVCVHDFSYNARLLGIRGWPTGESGSGIMAGDM